MDKQLRKADMGWTGAIIILCQVISSFQASKSVSEELKDLKISILDIRVDQEKNFVRKEQAKTFEAKIEEIKEDVKDIKKQIKHLRSEYAYSDPKGIVGCAFMEDKRHAFSRRDYHFTAFTH
jgi:hypothetical protein